MLETHTSYEPPNFLIVYKSSIQLSVFMACVCCGGGETNTINHDTPFYWSTLHVVLVIVKDLNCGIR